MVSYGLVSFGQLMLWLCFLLSAASAVFLAVGHFGRSGQSRLWGYRLCYAACASIFISCMTIVIGFFGHNVASAYVAQNYPKDTGSLFWLYKLSGLWAGRAGSLLFWGFLISAFAAFVAWKRRAERDNLSTVALMVLQIVLLMFAITMLFSSSNNPFIATNAAYIAEDGSLTGVARLWGMNALLEHWAMVLHPPTLFVGYAGLSVPFAYCIAALVVNDPSRRWIDLCQRIALFAFIFLTIGIGLGAVWAYVVLGWGGYWGWDPVENASLLSWLTSVAMLHSFNVTRRRAMMRGWSMLGSLLTFVFVILGTFITRSGLVQSVHAFSEDTVSTTMFLVMMLLAIISVLVLWFVRRHDFASYDDIESIASKNGSYYLTALVMVFSAILLAYLTVASALPSWLPAGGASIGVGAYETISRPLGIFICLLAAVCPFLSWKRTDGPQFWKNVRLPLIISAVIFAGLVVIFFTTLLPAYTRTLDAGGTAAQELAQMGPRWYYSGLALLGLFAAAFLACASLYLISRGVRGRMKAKGEAFPVALARLARTAPAAFGGYLTHLGMGIILVGLVGSAMYVSEKTFDITNAGPGDITIDEYTISYEGVAEAQDSYGNTVITADLTVSSGGTQLATIHPSLSYESDAGAMAQTRPDAKIYGRLDKDLFTSLSLQMDSTTGAISGLYLSVRVNPLIRFVWIGFAVLTLGIICSLLMRKPAQIEPEAEPAGRSAIAGRSAGAPGARAARTSASRKKARPRKSR